MSREVALRLIEIFHDVAKRSDVASSWEEDMPNGLVAMEAALAALEAGDSLGGGLLVGREEWREVVKAAQNEGRQAAEAMREACAEIVEQEVGDIEAMPGPASILAEKVRKLKLLGD